MVNGKGEVKLIDYGFSSNVRGGDKPPLLGTLMEFRINMSSSSSMGRRNSSGKQV